jgi:hypothetical protein
MLKNMTMLEPSRMVGLYYEALYGGRLDEVKALMTKESYRITLETFGLRLALTDAAFKQLLKESEEDADALTKVETKLCAELISRKLTPHIEMCSIKYNGAQRQTAEYTEDGKSKKLYFSKEEEGWKIDYYAGRTVA